MAEEKITDARDELADSVVAGRFKYFIEQLEEHVGMNLGSYKNALQEELEWIEHEKRIRKALKRPPP